MTWEKVVLDERVNFPLYYPIDTNNIGSDRRSLYDVLTANIVSGGITNVYSDSYFTSKRSLKDLEDAMKLIDTLDIGYDQLNQDGYVVWYFDKRQGELKYRLLAIAPAAPDVNFIDSEDEENREPIPLYWIFYPDVRDILHEAKSFNSKNSAMPFSFDHILNARRFNGIIYKEENVHGDRKVEEYVTENALMQLLESERIKEKIRNFELDMWSYYYREAKSILKKYN